MFLDPKIVGIAMIVSLGTVVAVYSLFVIPAEHRVQKLEVRLWRSGVAASPTDHHSFCVGAAVCLLTSWSILTVCRILFQISMILGLGDGALGAVLLVVPVSDLFVFGYVCLRARRLATRQSALLKTFEKHGLHVEPEDG